MLEFKFYWADISNAEAHIRLVRALLANTRIDVAKLKMEGARGTTRDVAEIVTPTTMPEAVASHDHRPLTPCK